MKLNIHPGEVLLEEFLKPLGMSQATLSKATGISRHRIGALVSRRARITANDALRLSRFFGTSPEFWLNMWNNYELVKASLDPTLHMIEPIEMQTSGPIAYKQQS